MDLATHCFLTSRIYHQKLQHLDKFAGTMHWNVKQPWNVVNRGCSQHELVSKFDLANAWGLSHFQTKIGTEPFQGINGMWFPGFSNIHHRSPLVHSCALLMLPSKISSCHLNFLNWILIRQQFSEESIVVNALHFRSPEIWRIDKSQYCSYIQREEVNLDVSASQWLVSSRQARK